MREKPFTLEVELELKRARNHHATPHRSRHEGLSILHEEFEEVREAVYRNHENQSLYNELVQVAAMAQRMAEDLKL